MATEDLCGPVSPCNCATLRKASRRVSQVYDSFLVPCGLKSTQFAMLDGIERRRDDPPTIGELAGALVMDQSTIGQNLRPLERDGLVLLESDAKDRRRRQVKLTRQGRARLERARLLWNEAQLFFEKNFGKTRAADLRSILSTIALDRSFAEAAETSTIRG